MGWFDRLFSRAAPSRDIEALSPAAVRKRLSDLGLDSPSVDESSRIDESAIPRELPDYDDGPIPELDWIVDIAPAPGNSFVADAVRRANDDPGSPALGPSALFVRSGSTGWRVQDADEPSSERLDALALACRLLVVREDGAASASADLLQRVLAAAEVLAVRLGGTARPRMSVEAGLERVGRLRGVWPLGSAELTAILKAPHGGAFGGREVWDTLSALGLAWSDGDLFHWHSGHFRGLFAVSTTTPPGYFLPEEIVSGKLRPRDLVFKFAVADSPAPIAVLEAVIAAASYARERLGGELVGHDGSPFDADADREGMRQILSEMASAGIAPGSRAAGNFW